MHWLYNFSIFFYYGLIRLAALFNHKAALWVNGRKGLWKTLENVCRNQDKVVWFHAASLGEFEQGRPVIEAYREKHSDAFILLTFFSPSGYEIRKNYPGTDAVVYLPMDTPANVRRFIAIAKPYLAVFIKYEFWFNYLRILHQNQIPVYLISAIFRPDQHFFKTYGKWFRKQLLFIDHFFVQNEESQKLLQSIGISRITVSGDTRFDRVAEIARQKKSFPLIEKFAKDHAVLLAGSTWPPDENLLPALFQSSIPQLKLIIAPHEVGEDRIQSLMEKFSSFDPIRYSTADEQNISKARVLIIDGMGFLSRLYPYCQVAYIGGGFGKGIHNILEAATFGKPVIFGSNYQKFAEAIDLVDRKGAFVIDQKGLTTICTALFNNSELYQKAQLACLNYIDEKKGATQMILNELKSR